MLGLGQPPRSFWQLPAGTPEWMRPPDWMALGSPGKLVGITWDPKLRQYVMVEAAAGLGSPGKIVGYNPDTGEIYYAAAGIGQIPAAAQEAARRAAEAAAAAARAQARARTTTPTSAQAAAEKAAAAAAAAAAAKAQATRTATAEAKAAPPVGLIVLGVGAAALVVGLLMSRRRAAAN